MSKISVIKQPYAPIVEYTPLAMHKIKHLVRECEKEVGWFGSVSQQDGDDYKYFLIEDIYVPVQSVTGTETDVKAEDLIKLYEEIEAGGVDLSKVFYWGHSHVNMPPNPSGQDESQLLDYGEAYPVFLRGIYNKAGVERMDVFDFKDNLRFDGVDAGIMVPSMSDADKTSLSALIKERVKERSFAVNTYNNKYGTAGRHTIIPGGKHPPARADDLFDDDFYDSYGYWPRGGGDDFGHTGFSPSKAKPGRKEPVNLPSINSIHGRL